MTAAQRAAFIAGMQDYHADVDLALGDHLEVSSATQDSGPRFIPGLVDRPHPPACPECSRIPETITIHAPKNEPLIAEWPCGHKFIV